MKRTLLALTIVGATTFAGLAQAQDDGDTWKVTSTIQSGGTAKKPKPVTPTFALDAIGATPTTRPASPQEHDWSWTNVQENGKYFPKCTGAQIDAAQSDSVCKPSAVVATGSLTAFLGPDGDRNTNTNCVKQIKIYNEGAGKANLYAYGDAAACAGVGYLPPIPITWTKKGHTSTQVFVFPDNIVHPLPGVSGAFSHIDYKFVKRTVTVGKGKKAHKVGYLMSYGGCKEHTFTFLSKTTAGTQSTRTADAGKC